MSGKKLFRFDEKLKNENSSSQGNFCLIGVDEAGRGPLAGPVVACALVLHPSFYDHRLDDSKKLDPFLRAVLYRRLKRSARWAFGLGQVSLIDSINILRATHRAMHAALHNLLRLYPDLSPDLVAIDGNPIPPTGHRQMSIVKGDSKSASIAAASVMAKVFRDKIMRTLNTRFPGYGLHRHKGYATPEHQEKLARIGPSPIHRKSFYPVRSFFEPAVED